MQMNSPYMWPEYFAKKKMIKYARNLRSPLHPNSHTKSKHDHRKSIDEHFGIYQRYAVDISGVITTDKNTNDHIKMTVWSELGTGNFDVK